MNENNTKFIEKLIHDKMNKEKVFSNHRDIITNGNMVPIEVSDTMVSNIPESVISSSISTFLVAFCGTGSFVISLLKRLLTYHSIEDSLNRIYICEESRSVSNFFLRKIYNNKNIHGGTIMDEGFENIFNKKFTCVITNPPYNSERGDNNQSVDIYPEFVDKAFELSDRYVIMITKSNWMNKPSMKDFREKMINKYNVDKIVHYPENPFKGTLISGGVSYFVIDNQNTKKSFELNGVVYDRKVALDFLPYELNKNELSVLSKLLKMDKISLSNFRPKGYYGINTNDSRIKEVGDIECHVSEQKGKLKYLNQNELDKKMNDDLNKYKIFSTSSYGANPYSLGRLLKGYNQLCSSSLVNWVFNTEVDMNNFFDYLNTKFFRFCVSLIKNKQDISKNTFSLIPNIDFSKLEKVDDENIYKYLKLTEEDIQTIEERCERLRLMK